MEIGTRALNSSKVLARLLKVSYLQTFFTAMNFLNGNNIVNISNNDICNENNSKKISNNNNKDIIINNNNSYSDNNIIILTIIM